jgi:putative Holliday junction resolvase
MRILGIDFGDRNLGLAVSDPLNITAQGIGRYQSRSRKADLAYFRGLVAEYGIGRIVVGLPLRMDGSVGTRAEATREFAEWLEKNLDLPVDLWDERLTTRETRRILAGGKASRPRKKILKDQIAATLILSGYLENRSFSRETP